MRIPLNWTVIWDNDVSGCQFESRRWSESITHIYKYIYIRDLVCYTNSHWFFKNECQHIFGKQTGYIFQSPKNGNMDNNKITLHWIKSIIRNNKCIFAKLNAVFVLKTVVWRRKNILHQIIPSHIPDRFSKLLSSTTVT